MYIWTHKITYIFLITLFFFTGCGGGSQTVSSKNDLSSVKKAIQEGHVIDYATKKGIENVKVNIGTISTITDVNGFYKLSNITPNKEVVVNFEKSGYLTGSTRIELKSLSEEKEDIINYLEYSISTYNNQWNYKSSNNAKGGHIDIPPLIYRDINDLPYEGNINAKLKILDMTTNEGKTLFSGSFEGINTNGNNVQFISYGLISLQLTDIDNHSLNFINNASVILTFDAIASLTKENIIPLWYYNYERGIWIEDGYAEFQTDGTYKGEISHTGTWTIAKIIDNEAGILRGRILYPDGSAVSNARVSAIGNNWIHKDLSTDENGQFEIEVIADSTFKLEAYNYKYKYNATYNGIIPAISAGEIIEK